jgi:hypothetical protein
LTPTHHAWSGHLGVATASHRERRRHRRRARDLNPWRSDHDGCLSRTLLDIEGDRPTTADAAAEITRTQQRGVVFAYCRLGHAAAMLGACRVFAAGPGGQVLSKRPAVSTATAAWPGGATLWLNARSRAIGLLVPADF